MTELRQTLDDVFGHVFTSALVHTDDTLRFEAERRQAHSHDRRIMIAPQTRRLCARAMPHGLSESVALETQRSLEGPPTPAAPSAIARILRHATSQVPLYRRLEAETLDQLPVVDKSMMVAAPDDFFAAGFRPEQLTSRISSGSSGVPFTSYFDAERIARHRAQLVGGYRALGADPFGPFVHCRPWVHATRRDRASYALRGQHLYAGERDDESIRAVARWMRRRPRITVMGLSSFLETLLRGFERLGITHPPGTVGLALGVGEPASRYLAEAVPRLFGIPLTMRYSNTENGILGFTNGSSPQYTLDTSTFHVEILDQDSDRPARPGALGRVVVTDLYNRAMPFLRYDTGDLGRFAVGDDRSPLPNVLAELAGRSTDVPIAGTVDAPVRAGYFQLFMRIDDADGLRQFQLRQRAIGRFTWVLDADPSPELEHRIRQVLDEEVGDILSCDFRYVGPGELATEGKRRFFVSDIPDPEKVLEAARRGSR